MQSKSLWVVMIFFGIITSAHAQDKKPKSDPVGTAYKQTLPDGSVIYTDRPNRAVKIEKTLAPEPTPAYVPRVSPSVGLPPGYALQKPSGSPLTPGVPGTQIPSMPPLPGDSIVRPVAPTAPVSNSVDASPKPVVAAPIKIDEEILKAEEDLSKAIKLQKDGIASEPGERSGTASGGSRLNSTYQQRQDELAANVKNAQAEVERLYLKKRSL